MIEPDRPKMIRAKCTSYLCPEQWEGELEGGKKFFARERHDDWRIEVDDIVVASGQGHGLTEILSEVFDVSDAYWDGA